MYAVFHRVCDKFYKLNAFTFDLASTLPRAKEEGRRVVAIAIYFKLCCLGKKFTVWVHSINLFQNVFVDEVKSAS